MNRNSFAMKAIIWVLIFGSILGVFMALIAAII